MRLLQRTDAPRSTPTAEGRLFYERAREILDELDAAEELVGAGRLRPRGTLRVSLSHGFGMSQIVPLVPAFGARYPEIELQLAFADRRLDLVSEGLDVALAPRPGPRRRADRPPPRRPWPHRLRRPGLCRAPRPAGARRRTSPATTASCSTSRTISTTGRSARADGTVQRLRMRGNFRSDNGDALLELLLGGRGIAHAADFLALPHLAAGRLVPLLPAYAVDERTPIHAVYPQRRHLPAKVRAFIDFLATALRLPPWLTWHVSVWDNSSEHR